jgi:catechol 2,3-dioxygenase-like lactoylglutathione lyase family enzyme
MALPLDHIVIAVHDLDAAVADYRALGFQVAIGGRHPGRTSHNALVVIADGAYLEIIAWTAPAPEERWYRRLRDHGEGLVDFALLPPSTAQALAEARARGLDTLVGPVDGGRVRPDGAQLLWQTARHATPDLPFLCGDITPRALRVPEGSVREHPNGAQGVASLTVAVHDLDASLGRYKALLGPGLQETADSEGVRLALPGFDLLLQGAQAQPSKPGFDALRQRLATRGEGPCAFTLRQRPGATAPAFDPAASHGVAMRWQNGNTL